MYGAYTSPAEKCGWDQIEIRHVNDSHLRIPQSLGFHIYAFGGDPPLVI